MQEGKGLNSAALQGSAAATCRLVLKGSPHVQLIPVVQQLHIKGGEAGN